MVLTLSSASESKALKVPKAAGAARTTRAAYTYLKSNPRRWRASTYAVLQEPIASGLGCPGEVAWAGTARTSAGVGRHWCAGGRCRSRNRRVLRRNGRRGGGALSAQAMHRSVSNRGGARRHRACAEAAPGPGGLSVRQKAPAGAGGGIIGCHPPVIQPWPGYRASRRLRKRSRGPSKNAGLLGTCIWRRALHAPLYVLTHLEARMLHGRSSQAPSQ